MKFLALSPLAAIGLLGLVALVIVLLHLLKPAPQRVVVASVLVWARVRPNQKRTDIRRLLMLILALCAGLSLAFALTQPRVSASGAQRLVVILDNSLSMGARTGDGLTRWQHAVADARALLDASGAADEVLLLDTIDGRRGSGFVDRPTALGALDEMPLPSWGKARVPPQALVDDAEIHLFTDGVTRLDVPERTIVHSMFEPAENIAVTAFETRPILQDPTRYEALVQVLNASPTDLRARLLITGNDEFTITQDIDLSAGETVNATFDVSDFSAGVLGAVAVSDGDALSVDDVAFAVVPPHEPRRVLLVTAGNSQLQDALSRLPGVRLDVIEPDRYSPETKHDAVVFDRVAPAQAPAVGCILFRPPPREWLAQTARVVRDPRVAGWDVAHTIAGGIAWHDLRLTRAALMTASEITTDALVKVKGYASAALVASGFSQARWIQVGFALEDSNFALRPDFPLFLGKALEWIDAPTPVLTRQPGTIEVALPGAQILDGNNEPVASAATPRGVVFEAPGTDVFTASAPNGRIIVVVNVTDPDYARINRTALPERAKALPESKASVQRRRFELWDALLLLAVAFLLMEWFVFNRPRKG